MRIVRGGGALVVLLAGVVGVPWLLVVLGGNPFPARWDLHSIHRALLRPDDGTVLIGLITVVAWAAWLVFAVSVMTELVRGLTGRHLEIPVPGLAGPRRLVAGLVLAVLALASAPSQMSGDLAAPVAVAQPFDRAPVGVSPAPDLPLAPLGAPRAEVPGPEDRETHRHVVQPGDDLWTLAERYYGQGREWRTIAAANPDLLTGGPDRLQPGWSLAIPGADTTSTRIHVVRPGETLSSIAFETYDDSDHWHELFLANRAQLADPDDLAVGTRLSLPSLSAIGPVNAPEEQSADGAAHEAEARQEKVDQRKAHHGKANQDDSGQDAPGQEESGQEESGQEESGHEKSDPDAPGQDTSGLHERPDGEGSTAGQDPARVPTGDQTSGSGGGQGGSTTVPAAPVPQTAAVDAADDRAAAIVAGAASIGGLLAAGVIAGLALRRRTQRQLRPVGRRILAPPVAAEVLEATLGRRQRPLGRRTLDLAVRAIGAHCHHTGAPLPELELVRLTDERIVLEIAGDAPPPAGFRVDGSTWVLHQEDVDDLMVVPGLSEASRPYPALVCVGRDQDGAQLLVDLEHVGLIGVAATGDLGEAVLTALVAELAFAAWSDEVVVTVVGSGGDLAEALGQHNVTSTEDLDGVLDRLEARAVVQRDHAPSPVLGQRRVDPDLADPWVPEVVLAGCPVTPTQRARLDNLLLAFPRVTMAAVLTGEDPATPWVLEPGDAASPVVLRRPSGASIVVKPQQLDTSAVEALGALVRSTSSDETERAPWWDSGESPPPSNVRYVERWGASSELDWTGEGVYEVAEDSGIDVRHPTLLLLGTVELVGAAGSLPPRAAGQCLEYCAWLLHRRENTARAMAAGLAVAEGTRRSNMSRLRTWLGDDQHGAPYLPDAYSGRIVLHDFVTSDWLQFQMVAGPAVNLTSTRHLRTALRLVRGAPLADAAPGQWHWAEEMRTDMISAVRDVGVELTERALLDRDIDLARWAASRALSVAPGDELLIRARIRTEHQAGNAAEVERLILQLASQARSLGIDLDPETVVLLQEMMEGQVRARLA